MNISNSVLSGIHRVTEKRHDAETPATLKGSPYATTTTLTASAPATPTRRRRVLIVEDEAPIRELLRLHLDHAGFEIEEIGDGTLGLQRARAAKFDLIVLDVLLPGLDGFTVCRAIRSQSLNAETAI